MSKYVIINASHGGSDKGNMGSTIQESTYTLKMAEEISKYLNQKGIANQLLRKGDTYLTEDTRIANIKSSSPDTKDTIVLTLSMDSPSNQEMEILYALRNSDKLASRMATSLEDSGFTVSKFYQRRLPSDTSKDYDKLIRETGNRETLLIEYGNLNDQQFIQNNWQKLAISTAEALATYLEEVGTFYTVQSGDSLYSIARRYGVSVDELKRVNNLGTNLLSLGQRLLIPEKKEEKIPSEEGGYIVQSGDTLYSIARKYGISVEELKQANNLKESVLSIGQKLQIPKIAKEESLLYTVKQGDSLYSIAARYGISVAELKSVNNLSSNLLSIGQKLMIPTKTTGTIYTVKSGDSLYTIARKYGVNVDAIMKANGLDSTLLAIGQKLTIPNS